MFISHIHGKSLSLVMLCGIQSTLSITHTAMLVSFCLVLPGVSLQEKKALSSRGRGRLRGFLELRRPWGFSPEARRGSQGASRAAPGKSGLPARSEEERVVALE